MAKELSELGAFTLFATHYFELTGLPDEMPATANVHLDAVEHGERIVFLHTVKDGPASRSYGLQVAALAGVPDRVLEQGRSILQRLENGPLHAPLGNDSAEPQIDLFKRQEECPLVDAFQGIKPDDLTPRQALELLYKLKQLAEDAAQ